MAGWEEFQGVNAGYLAELYDRYRIDPASVDATTREFFATWTPPPEPTSAGRAGSRVPVDAPASMRAVVGAVNLADSHPPVRSSRGSARPPRAACRSATRRSIPATYGVTATTWRPCPRRWSAGRLAERARNALEAIAALRIVYCSTTGYDFAQVFVPEEREWLRHAVETGRFRPPMDAHRRGGAARSHQRRSRPSSASCTARSRARRASRSKASTCCVPILDEVIDGGNDGGLRHVADRHGASRPLNVLAHVLGKPTRRSWPSSRTRCRRTTATASTSAGPAT